MSTESGQTRLAGVIGDPVRHSLSPTIRNAAYRHMGLDWTYVAFPVADGRAPEAVAGMRSLGISGLSVTMPHKAAVVAECDRLSPIAARLGMVNCISREGDILTGHNTDGDGLVEAVRSEFSFDIEGADCAVLGAGGAALAIIDAFARNGARSVTVINRTVERAEHAVTFADGRGRVGRPEDVAECSLVVNATPVGMASVGMSAEPLVPAGSLGAGHIVIDSIYTPRRTPLLVDATAAGARVGNGVSMLVHVSALAFQLFTGQEAPVKIMRAAVADAL